LKGKTMNNIFKSVAIIPALLGGATTSSLAYTAPAGTLAPSAPLSTGAAVSFHYGPMMAPRLPAGTLAPSGPLVRPSPVPRPVMGSAGSAPSVFAGGGGPALTPPSLLSPSRGGYRAPAGTLAPTAPLVNPHPAPGSIVPQFQAPIPPANSGWARPYSAGDGGIGVMGGGQKGNTRFQGNVYVPPSGSPFVQGTIVHNPPPPVPPGKPGEPSRSAEPSVNPDTNKR
jgi:hypothetical protein